MKLKSLFLLLLLVYSSNLFAGDFKLDKTTDLTIALSGIVLSGFDFVGHNFLHLKDTSYNSDYINEDLIPELDSLLMHKYNKALDYTATATLTLGFLAPAVLFPTQKSEWLTIGVMYAETIIWAYGAKEFGKLVTTRARPYMYFDNYPQKYVDDGDWCNSFFSGHSTWAFATATFTSYAFCKYFPESGWRYAVVFSSLGLASTTAALRILSGNHFYTDVLVGSIVGGVIGFVIPYLHTLDKHKNDTVQMEIAPLGVNFRIQM